MALTREQKEQKVKQASTAMAGAVSIVFMTYDALQIVDMNELRDLLHQAGVKMKVLPKRLLRIALQESKLDFDPMAHAGQMAIVWGDDAVAPAKALADFAKQHEQVHLAAGVMDPSSANNKLDKVILTAVEVAQLAKLPTREQLLGMLVSTIAGPMRGLASVLAGVPKSMVYVLQAAAEAKK